jgi:ABC-type lipoprotein export system ATPase subunit
MSSEDKKRMIECENLIKIYKTQDLEVVALQGLDLSVDEGEIMAIIGNSGSGKSTLLNMIGGLDKPTAGKMYVDDKDLFKLNEKQMIEYKRNTVGFVWQNNARNLIPYLSALENVELSMSIAGSKGCRDRALELLKMVSVDHRKNSRLDELSGGEQQRVAIAIALSNNPKILLADEPTGSVDTKTSGQILDLFRELNKSLNLTVVIVTHDRQIANKVDRVVAIRDGRTSSEFLRKSNYAEELEKINFESAMPEDTHVELAVLDRAGRLQVPGDYLEALGLKDSKRIKVELEDDKIVLYNPNSDNIKESAGKGV